MLSRAKAILETQLFSCCSWAEINVTSHRHEDSWFISVYIDMSSVDTNLMLTTIQLLRYDCSHNRDERSARKDWVDMKSQNSVIILDLVPKIDNRLVAAAS